MLCIKATTVITCPVGLMEQSVIMLTMVKYLKHTVVITWAEKLQVIKGFDVGFALFYICSIVLESELRVNKGS